MDAISIIKERRSVRKFQEKAVDRSSVGELVAAATYAPSWANFQIARYTLVDSREKLIQLAEEGLMGFAPNRKVLAHAAGAVIVSYVKGIGNSIDTANLINTTRPQLVGVISRGVFAGSELEKEMAANRFVPTTEREILEVENMRFFGDHPINMINISGTIPEDKKDMIGTIDYLLAHGNPEALGRSLTRSTL